MDYTFGVVPAVKARDGSNAVKLIPRYVIESPCKHDIEWV
jgi:hypothetical protein